MLKRWMRKWLGVAKLENNQWAHPDRLNSHESAFANYAGDVAELNEAYDRLKNRCDSNRMRIDTIEGRLGKTDAFVAQLRLIGLPTPVLQAPKKGRPKKPTTPKKGK